MNYFHMLCFVCVWCQISCAPTDISFYEAILQKCPSVKSIDSYKQHPLITNTCKDWKTISALTGYKNNDREILCLLFFESFTEYCSKGKVTALMSDAILIPYNLDDVCKYAKTVKRLSDIFSKEGNCAQICGDEMGSVRSVCRSAYYFALASTASDVSKDQPQVHQDAPHVPPPGDKPSIPSKESHNKPIDKSVISPDLTEKSAGAPQPETEKSPDIPPSEADGHKGKVPAAAMLPPNPENKPPPDPKSHKSLEVAPHVQVSDVNPKLSVENGANPAPDLKPAPQIPDLPNQVSHSTDRVVQQEQPSPPQEVQEANPKGNDGTKIKDVSTPNVVETPIHPQVSDNGNGAGVIANPNDKQSGKSDHEIKNEESLDPDLDDPSNQLPLVDPNQANLGEDDVDVDDGQGDSLPDSLRNEKDSKPLQTDESEPVNYNTEMEGDSYFFTYFMLLCMIFIVGYVCYHNKQKILALILEGRRGKRQYRGRRPNSANYHKLDSNLEEAITSSCKKNTNNVIY